jgi:hypothetical protein
MLSFVTTSRYFPRDTKLNLTVDIVTWDRCPTVFLYQKDSQMVEGAAKKELHPSLLLSYGYS